MKIIKCALLGVFLLNTAVFADCSKEEIKKIVRQYEKVCVNADYKLWCDIYYQQDSISEAEFLNKFSPTNRYDREFSYTILPSKYSYYCPKKISIKRIDGGNVELRIVWEWKKEDDWLQILPNGKIKYDPFINRHPILIAIKNCIPFYECNCEWHHKGPCRNDDKYFSLLESTGIPLFGLSLSGTKSEKREACKKIKKWIKKNGGTWDNSDPKISCPPKQFKEYIQGYPLNLI